MDIVAVEVEVAGRSRAANSSELTVLGILLTGVFLTCDDDWARRIILGGSCPLAGAVPLLMPPLTPLTLPPTLAGMVAVN